MNVFARARKTLVVGGLVGALILPMSVPTAAQAEDAQSGSAATPQYDDGPSAPDGSVAPDGGSPSQAKAYARSRGVTGRQYNCLNKLWTRESHWRWNARNRSGAYGIPQALPGRKMASEGRDWRTNYKTQVRWGLKYIKGRPDERTPCGAWAHERKHGWY